MQPSEILLKVFNDSTPHCPLISLKAQEITKDFQRNLGSSGELVKARSKGQEDVKTRLRGLERKASRESSHCQEERNGAGQEDQGGTKEGNKSNKCLLCLPQ